MSLDARVDRFMEKELTVAKVTQRITMAAMLFVLAVLCVLPVKALATSASGAAALGLSAAASSFDGSDISLTVRYESDEGFIPGAMVSVYRVADVLPDGTLVPVEELANLPLDWNIQSAADARELADTIETYLIYSAALRDVLYESGASDSANADELALLAPVDVAITDGNGVATFPCEAEILPVGCYLIMAEPSTGAADFYEASSSMLALPYSYESGEVDHSPVVSLKVRGFSLSRTVSLDVAKSWEVGERSTATVEADVRPAEVNAVLLCDGVIYDKVALSEDNGWQHSWTGLAAGHQWNVVEEEVPEGYTVSLVKDGTSVTIVNTCTVGEPYEPDVPVKPDTPSIGTSKPSQKLPQTGQLWWPVPVLLLIGVACVRVGIRGRRRNG